MVAVFPIGVFAGPHEPAADVLADSDGDATLLCEPNAVDQSLVAEEEVDLDMATLSFAPDGCGSGPAIVPSRERITCDVPV